MLTLFFHFLNAGGDFSFLLISLSFDQCGLNFDINSVRLCKIKNFNTKNRMRRCVEIHEKKLGKREFCRGMFLTFFVVF